MTSQDFDRIMVLCTRYVLAAERIAEATERNSRMAERMAETTKKLQELQFKALGEDTAGDDGPRRWAW